MQLSHKEWIDLLSKDYSIAKERVIIVLNKLTKTLSIKKDDWQNYFSGYGGIDLKKGEEIEIIPATEVEARVEISSWVKEYLEIKQGDTLCITRRDGKYYLKRLQFVEQSTEIPVCLIVDKFEKTFVERTYWNNTDFEQFTAEVIDKLLSIMPGFQHDPVAPFEDMKGRLGFMGRKHFFGGFTKSDEEAIEDYKRELCKDQQDDGSWEQSATHTAFKLIRLLEVGATMEYPPVEKAAEWLLQAKEPLGMPGLFMYSEKIADSFNAWEEKQVPGSNKRGSRSSTAAQRRFFMENKDVFGSSNAYCELKLTWSTAVVLEALLRCGLHQEPRVIKAINTLLSMSGKSGGWCGCGYFVANIYHNESTKPPDFNNCSIQFRGRSVANVGLETDDILRIVANHQYKGHEIDENKTLMVRTGSEGSGDCPMVIHRALSYHPAYHGSKMETMLALHCSTRQGWMGDWTGNYASFFLSLLSRSRCPLSAFLVLKTVPMLIRQQREDGFWQEKPLSQGIIRNKPIPTPSKEESTFMILMALKTFGLLDHLRS